jgi:hypothetical protein
MSLNESIVEDAMKRVKIEIGRVKSWEPFPISLFNFHSSSPRRLNPAIPSRPLATLRDTLLPKLLIMSGDLRAWRKLPPWRPRHECHAPPKADKTENDG